MRLIFTGWQRKAQNKNFYHFLNLKNYSISKNGKNPSYFEVKMIKLKWRV